MNIFGEGMVLGTILEQIEREGSLHQEATRLTPEREKGMWISITTAIVHVKSRGNIDKDWSYFGVMLTNVHTLFKIIQSKTNRLVFDEKLLTDFLADPF